MSPSVANDFTQLWLHVLAHVPLAGPGSTFDPRYVAWVAEHAPGEHLRVLTADAAVLRRVWAEAPPSLALHGWPQLFDGIAGLQRVASRSLADISPDEVRAPDVLTAMQRERSPAFELLHATLAVLAPSYQRWWSDAIEAPLGRAADELRSAFASACTWWPPLGSRPVELAWALGPRGRGFASRLVVGAPADWHGGDPSLAVVLALHEQAVIDSGHATHAHAEWAALTGLAARMREASDGLRRAHARWLASLELAPLLTELLAAGVVDDAVFARVRQEPGRRTEVLARLATR